MTTSPEVLILDVGHGNCSVISADGSVCIVDAPTGTTLFDTLRHQGIKSIDTLIVSHADKDHVAGICALLTSEEVEVKLLYVNPDATKGGGPKGPWGKLRLSVADARRRTGLKVITSVTSDNDPPIAVGRVTLEILAPSPELIMGGAGSTDPAGKKKLTANSVSAVIRVNYQRIGVFLLPGDLDAVGLRSMIAEGKDAKSKVLIYPHHGGLPGDATPEDFTRELCGLIEPEVVIFSHGRENFSNPRPEIVKTIRGVSAATIVCTQLSRNCLPDTASITASHLHDIPARGREDRHCCAGSILFRLDDFIAAGPDYLSEHRNFVATCIPLSLCKFDASR